MSLRTTAYYGLLVCLVALFALGLQPLRFGKASVAQRNTKEAPAEESGDEETESEIDSPVRRRFSTGLPDAAPGRFLVPVNSAASFSGTFSVAPSPRGEHSARNGIGGPLRL